MSEAIAIVEGGLEPLPELSLVAEQVKTLVGENAAGVLDEVRRRADAAGLYEQRRHHADRERHYWILKVLAEAGLGCLSFEDDTVIDKSSLRNDCRILASAFERDDLLTICKTAELPKGRSSSMLAWRIRDAGYPYAPGKSLGREGSIRWMEARLIARDTGVPLTSIPPDRAYIAKRKRMYSEMSRRQSRALAAGRRLDQMRQSKLIAAAAKEHGPGMDIAYGYLRKTLQALTDAQSEMTRMERANLDRIFTSLHEAEDEIGVLLRIPDSQQRARQRLAAAELLPIKGLTA